MRRASSIPQHTAVDEYEGGVFSSHVGFSLDNLSVSCIATICPFRASTPTVCASLILLHVVTPFPFYSPLYVLFGRIIFAVDVVVRASKLYNFVVQSVCDAPIINTSYQKLSFGSGDHPDELLLHQALN